MAFEAPRVPDVPSARIVQYAQEFGEMLASWDYQALLRVSVAFSTSTSQSARREVVTQALERMEKSQREHVYILEQENLACLKKVIGTLKELLDN